MLINIVIGFDQREAIAYHVFCQSIIMNSSSPVQFIPLANSCLNFYTEKNFDGSNKFVYSRFLTPFIMGYKGWAIFADGDMVCNADISELWNLRDNTKAIQVVKHQYKTKRKIKYFNNINEDYPRKNWSSLILWNCEHPAHKVLPPEFISESNGTFLHRFSWLGDDQIGSLPSKWNWLPIEYPDNPEAKIIHYTLGTPCFKEYRNSQMSDLWHSIFQKTIEGLEQ